MFTKSVSNKLRFQQQDSFEKELKKRVDEYFVTTGKPKRDCPEIYLKTLILLVWSLAAYLLLLFGSLPTFGSVLCLVSLGISITGIGFNIMHDAIHQSYSNNQNINKIMSFSIDLIGGSSYFWYWKHNYLHHTFPNIKGHDEDIEVGALARLCPHNKRYYLHRFQHIYLWFLYGFITVKWHFWDDFVKFARGTINGIKIKRPKGFDLITFILGKVVFYSLILIIPSFFFPIYKVLLGYLLVSFIQGIIMSVIFQLAHCHEEAEFPLSKNNPPEMETTWMVHQLETTTNFARNNKLLSWYIGGLNYQIEHHLFPRISHINYPEISKIVEQTSNEFGIRYFSFDTLRSSIISHFNWLYKLGRYEV